MTQPKISKLNKLAKIILWIFLFSMMLIIAAIIFIRQTRMVDEMIYQSSNFKPYPQFESTFPYQEEYIELEDGNKIHTVLFEPDHIKPIATIFHCLGKGENLINAQNSYKPFLENGFQIFSFEYRGVGLSTGESINSEIIKEDVLMLFDKMLEKPSIKNRPIIVWGRSMGSAFATIVASVNQKYIKGLVLEGSFSSFPDIARYYADAVHLKKFQWLIPLIMHNDFPAEEVIKSIHKPVLIVHSIEDKAVPFVLGKKLYDASNKDTTFFWTIKGRHIEGVKRYEKQYIQKFKQILEGIDP